MTVTGTFKCVKSTENHRELVAEIEFKVVDCNGNTIDERPVQTFQIR